MNITITYIGDKSVKTDTLTNSRYVFPRLQPVDVPDTLAYQLLAHHDVFIEYANLENWQTQQAQLQAQIAFQAEQNALKAAQLAQLTSYEVPTLFGTKDISKYTSAQLETLAESEGLGLTRDPSQPVDLYRDQIRDLLKARAQVAAPEAKKAGSKKAA